MNNVFFFFFSLLCCVVRIVRWRSIVWLTMHCTRRDTIAQSKLVSHHLIRIFFMTSNIKVSSRRPDTQTREKRVINFESENNRLKNFPHNFFAGETLNRKFYRFQSSKTMERSER